MSEET